MIEVLNKPVLHTERIRMKITVNNIAKILEADVVLDGVTVIAGYNNMGKSTILKAAYMVFRTFRNVNHKILDVRRESIRSYFLKQESYFSRFGYDEILRDCLLVMSGKVCENLSVFMNDRQDDFKIFKKIFYDSFEIYKTFFTEEADLMATFSDNFIMPVYKGFKEICIRDKKDDIKYIGNMYIRNLFKNQMNSLYNKNKAFIHIDSDSEHYFMSVNDNKIEDMSYSANTEEDVFYLPAYNLLDVMETPFADKRRYSPEYDIKEALPAQESEPNFEEYLEMEYNTKLIKNILKEVIHGKLERLPSGQLSFKDDNLNDFVSIGNVASGMKNFLIIQSLAEKGKLKRNSILLIDEPETNLHPEWHLKFAEVLVLMYKHMGVRSIVNSHSPYFIRALEVKMADYGIKDKGHYYLTEEAGQNLFRTQDVTEATDKIYELLYRPLEYL